MKTYVVGLTVVLILEFILVPYKCEALKCPGKCTKNTAGCKANGGKIVGYCTNELACCDLTAKTIGSCGATKSGISSATFESPEYPDFSSGDLVCKFIFEISPNTQGLAVEFIDGRMEGCGFMPHSACESDMIFLQGFPKWQPPPRCGNLTGYGAIIDQRVVHDMKSLTVLAIMSSRKYRWKIKITQLTHSKTVHDSEQDMGEIPSNSDEEDTLQISQDEMKDFLSFRPRYRELSQFQDRRIIRQPQPSWIEPDDSSEDERLEFEEPLVVNGEDTMISEVPWQASLRMVYSADFIKAHNLSENMNKESSNCSSADGLHFCGGSIISNQHILSASHCFHGSSKLRDWQTIGNVKVVLGDTDLCADDKIKYGQASKVYTIDKVMFHYAYADDAILNDVLVIKLNEKIKFNDYIKPIALSKRNRTYVGKQVKVSGWGLTNLTIPHPSLPYILQSTEGMVVQDQDYCDSITLTMYSAPKRIISKFPKYEGTFLSTLCTTTFGEDPAFKLVGQGDSGGPLIFRTIDKSPVQIGVVSFGVPALPAKREHDNKFVDFFQDVSYFRDWIDLAMLA